MSFRLERLLRTRRRRAGVDFLSEVEFGLLAEAWVEGWSSGLEVEYLPCKQEDVFAGDHGLGGMSYYAASHGKTTLG